VLLRRASTTRTPGKLNDTQISPSTVGSPAASSWRLLQIGIKDELKLPEALPHAAELLRETW